MSYCSLLNNNADSMPQPFWVNVSGNDIIILYARFSIEESEGDKIGLLQDLMDGKSVKVRLSEFSAYPVISKKLILFIQLSDMFLIIALTLAIYYRNRLKKPA